MSEWFESYTTLRSEKCEKCGAARPDPDKDVLTLFTCPNCGARYIRLHYFEGRGFWRRLKWWQRCS